MKFKNYVLTIMKALVLTAMTVGLANCSKDDKSGSVTTAYRCFQMNYNGSSTQVDNSYCYNSYNSSYQNGGYSYQCRDVNNAVVANNLCVNSTVGVTGYSLNQYGYCIQTSTGQQVPQNYCTSGGSGQVCNGMYLYNGNPILCGTVAQANAVVYNCQGFTMTNQAGQQVLCK